MTEYICKLDKLIDEIVEILHKTMELSKAGKSFDGILIKSTEKLKEFRKQNRGQNESRNTKLV